MPFRKQRRDAGQYDAQPRGVRIHHADGRVSECSLVRDPESGPDGCVRWIAEPPPGVAIGFGDTLGVDYMPAGDTVISLPMDLD